MTHPFNGSSPSAATEHLLFINHYHWLLSTAWFSALPLNSVVETLEPEAGTEQAAGCCLPTGLTLKGQEQFELS